MRLENAERALVESSGQPVYVITGPLFERLMRPLPNGPQMHRVPSGYWKVVATTDGRATAFIMDQSLPRNADFCDQRAPLVEVELRARLDLFPADDGVGDETLDDLLGCTTPRPDRPLPEEIPE